MRKSVRRMAGLIDDVLDFARGRLGGGLSLTLSDDQPLTPALEQVIAELRMSFPDRVIETDFAHKECLKCDRTRISQLLSNLAANALTYSYPGTPVRARTRIHDGVFELSVSNQGEPIPPQAMARLFAPYERGAVRPSQQGPRSRPVHRLRNRARPWRDADGDFHRRGNLLHAQNANLNEV